MSIPPRPGDDWRFNAPPGWPTPPEGWVPSVAWGGPEDDWPPAPPYWRWWVREDGGSATHTATPEPDERKPAVLRSAGTAALSVLLAAGVVAALVGVSIYVSRRQHPQERLAAEAREASAPSATSVFVEKATPTPSPTPTAHEQAVIVDEILALSEPSRGALRRGIGQVLRCDEAEQGIATIRQVTGERKKQRERAEELVLSDLDDGALKSTLVTALSASHRADKAYLKWAKRFEAGGCRGATVGDPAYDEGNAASATASRAKAEFVTLWNPIARREGLSARSADEI